MSSEIHPTNAYCLEAIDRIARTPDGAALYVFLQRRLMSISPTLGRSALRQDEGERIFAAKLISAMTKGISESGGRAGITGSSYGPDGREQPIVVPSPRPVNVRNPGSTRRINERTIVPGWNDHPADD